MLKAASENLDKIVDELRDEIFAQSLQNPHQNIFKTREVYDIIRRQYFALKKDYVRNIDLKFDLQHKIISPQRATEMAKNIFVHGDFKKIRVDFRQLKKDEQKFEKNLLIFKNREQIFLNRDWSIEERNLFLQEKYFLARQKTLLELEKNRLDTLNFSLSRRQTESEKICQNPDSLKKNRTNFCRYSSQKFKICKKI